MIKLSLYISFSIALITIKAQENSAFSIGDTLVLNNVEFIVKDSIVVNVINDVKFLKTSSRINLNGGLYNSLGDCLICLSNNSTFYLDKRHREWLSLYIAEYDTLGNIVGDVVLDSEVLQTDSGDVFKLEVFNFYDSTYKISYVYEEILNPFKPSYIKFNKYNAKFILERSTLIWYDEYGYLVKMVSDEYFETK